MASRHPSSSAWHRTWCVLGEIAVARWEGYIDWRYRSAPSYVDVSHVTDILHRVGQDAYNDDRLRKLMLDPPTVMGVEKIEVDTFSVRMVARTLPGVQFDVGRELRARVASAFRYEGINVSADLDTGRATGGAS